MGEENNHIIKSMHKEKIDIHIIQKIIHMKEEDTHHNNMIHSKHINHQIWGELWVVHYCLLHIKYIFQIRVQHPIIKIYINQNISIKQQIIIKIQLESIATIYQIIQMCLMPNRKNHIILKVTKCVRKWDNII